MKLNKGTILKASCDYIRQLEKGQYQQQNKLESAAKQYADRVRELEEILAKNGLRAPTKIPPDSHKGMHHAPFPDLIMESCLENNPLLHSDPLMSQAGSPSPNLAASQMSPDISWDPSNFSPYGNTQPMHANHNMDYS
ncbi:unnamed protein product, partial [Mesorhabditis belari]|uniref:BHLH domain-containing protein n=1 Tax=Mesorhabditis belari TaxID=2138241 RepID=A0AAF3F7U1_9BILA